jgi:hypothetical protein
VAAIDWLQQMALDDATELLREPASHVGKHMMMKTHQVCFGIAQDALQRPVQPN